MVPGGERSGVTAGKGPIDRVLIAHGWLPEQGWSGATSIN